MLLISFNFTNHSLSAQFGSIRFNKITSADGLSHEYVNTIIRDKTGYMWFGTRAGLNRYDGYDIKVFSNDPLDSLSICDSEIRSSLCTSSGELWFGTLDGLAHFNSQTNTFNNFHPPGLEEKTVVPHCLEEDMNHTLWIGTSQGLFVKRNSDEFLQRVSVLQPQLAELDSISIADFFFDKNKLYVATNGAGLWVLDATSLAPEIWTSSSAGWQKLYSNRVGHVLVDNIGNIWTAYRDGTIERRNSNSSALHIYSEINAYSRGDMQNQMAELVMDHQGNIWVSTSLSGLSRFDESTNSFLHLKDKPSITAFDNTRSARSIYVDADGTIWLAMHTSGVLYFNLTKQSFINYERPDGIDEAEIDEVLLSNWTRVFAEDPLGRLWIGTVDGVSILDRETQTFTSLNNKTETEETLANNSIRSMLNVNNKYMLIGTAGGLTRYDFESGNIRNYYPDSKNPKAMRGDFVYDIQRSQSGEIYLSTSRGFSRYDEDTDTFYNWNDLPEVHKIFGSNTRGMVIDENGTIWIGISKGNIIEFHPSEKTVSEHPNLNVEIQSSNNTILDMLDDGGTIWVGTITGLMKFDKETKQYSKVRFAKRTAPSMVGNIWKDKNDVLWFSGNTGVVRYNTVSSATEYFDVHHGLPTNSFHFQHAFETSDGMLCMASLKGIVMFRPENLQQLISFPKAQITELRVLNEVMDLNRMSEQKLSLKYDENFFTITLNTFDYLQQDNIQFAFMLEGLHPDWVFNGKNRQLSFTNVAGGDYVLKYKTTTSDGIWSDEFQTLQIHIDTVFYKTWWFRIFILLFAVAIVYAVIRYRQQQKHKVETLRQKIASDLHDDIGATLSSIRMYSEVALTRKTDNEPLLEKISENARGMVDSMSDIVWAIKPGNDKFGDVQKRMQNFAMEMCGPADIELHFNFDESLSDFKLQMEHRKDIYLVFKEAVNNAVKYSTCKNLRVSISRNGNVLKLEIADDGRGFDSGTIKKGNGLDNMRMRVQMMKGKLNITSSENSGTQILCEVPFTHFG